MKVTMQICADNQFKQLGFSMVEILVTILIISLAVLGSAGLQVQALKTNQGGQFRNQAVFLLNDMVERMKANKVYSVSASSVPGYDTTLATTTDCGVTSCSPTQLAAYDVTQWGASIAAVLPQGTGTVTQTTTGNPSSYTVTINWVDRKTNTKYATAGAALATEAVSITTNIQIAN